MQSQGKAMYIVRRTHLYLLVNRFCPCFTQISPGHLRAALLSRATIHVLLFHKNEMFSEDIQKCQNVLEKGLLATVWSPLANTQKRLEKWCGWLFWNPKYSEKRKKWPTEN